MGNPEFIKYIIAGLINTCVGFVIYSGGIFIGMPFWLANFFSMVGGIISGYFLSRQFVFKSSKAGSSVMIQYICVMFSQYLFGTLAIGALIHLGFGEIISYVLLLPVAVIISYALQKFWVFKEHNSKNS